MKKLMCIFLFMFVIFNVNKADAGTTYPQAVCIIMFDDEYENVYDNALPILEANGQQAVMYTTTDNVGGSGYMSVDQLLVLQDKGWDISNHTSNHLTLNGESEADQRDAIDDGYDWLVTNGFSISTARFFAYPQGSYDSTSITLLRERHITGRGVTGTVEAHFLVGVDADDTEFEILGFGMRDTTTVNTVKAHINTAITNDTLFMPYMHEVLDTTVSTFQTATADLQEISDYLKEKEDAGDIDVMTMSEYYEAIKNYTTYDGVTIDGLTLE